MSGLPVSDVSNTVEDAPEVTWQRVKTRLLRRPVSGMIVGGVMRRDLHCQRHHRN